MLKPGETLTLSRGGLLIGSGAGIIQYGAVPETIKDTMVLESGVPSIFVVPPRLFSPERGISLAELEFPAYFNYFIKRRRVTVICRPNQKDKLVQVLSRSLFGPEKLSDDEFKATRGLSLADLQRELSHFKRNPFDRSRDLSLDDLVEIREFDPEGRVRLDESVELILESDDGFRVVEKGKSLLRVGAVPPLPPLVLAADSGISEFHRPVLGVSVIGSGHGFDAGNRTSGFILWLDGQGVMVDPPVDSTEWLKGYNVPPKQTDKLILTHCHADHDAGTLQKILHEGRITIYTSQSVLSNFVSKYAALTGMSEEGFRGLFEYVPVRHDDPIMISGAEFVFRYSLHSIPCLGFELSKGGKSVVYPSDTLNHPEMIQKLHEQGTLSSSRSEALKNFPWHHSLILHEAGIPPIHTPIEYLDTLPDDVKQRMFLMHVSSQQLVKTKELQVAPTGLENTIDLQASRMEIEDPIELLETMSRVDIFSDLPLSRATEFLRMIRRQRFRAGEKIVNEGELGDRFYIILQGKAAIMRGNQEIKTYAEYDYFGESALILNQPRNADVVAKTEMTCLTIDRADFLHLIRGTDLIKSLAQLAKIRDMPTWHLLISNRQLGNPTTNQLTQIQAAMSQICVPKGKIPSGMALLISSGKVQARVGREVVARFEEGDFVGDVRTLLSGVKSPYTFMAMTNLEGYSCHKGRFKRILHKNPGLYLKLRSILPTLAEDEVSM